MYPSSCQMLNSITTTNLCLFSLPSCCTQQTYYPSPLTYKEQGKRQVHWPWTFQNCNTLPHPGSSTLGGPPQPSQGSATPTTVLLFHTASCSYHNLASQDIAQVLQASALHHPHFCINPVFIRCSSLHTSSTMALFLMGLTPCSSNLLATGIWMPCSTTCISSPAPIMSGLSKLLLAGGNPQLIAETATMPLPNPTL